MKKLASLALLSLISLPVLAQSTSTVKHPAWSKNAAIYEANIRQHSAEGNFQRFQAYLPELKKMGVGIIWIMPINPIGEKNRKGTLGSYYAIRDYKGVNPEFGTPADFKNLVDAAHALGMKVIIDWVANHTAWDHPWVTSHPEYYLKNDKGEFVPPVADWQDVIKLNYANKELRAEMIGALKFWLTEYDIDGYRCDVAEMVPTDFWNEARAALDKVKPVFMLAEGEATDLHEKAFDMTYAWQLKDLFGEIAKGKKNANDLAAYMAGPEKKFHTNAYRMLHTSNHDLNSWEGTEFERLGDGAESFLVLSNLLKGMPLLYSGQEAGNTKRLEFFERDPIKWQEHPYKAIYTRLFQLKKSNQALWNGEVGAEQVRMATSNDAAIYAFSRSEAGNQVVGVFNLSGQAQRFSLHKPVAAGLSNLFTGKQETIQQGQQIELQPWEYKVLVK
ncbi:alpha-amylase family glycosyl hydrolase [Undibacterium sp. Di27W]|uniref:alpha-amylase family glycosyl hydrolase n=1 Tax=Undibacterium sp. Di27W TaxID=3413036 RepID=UPI003BF3A736